MRVDFSLLANSYLFNKSEQNQVALQRLNLLEMSPECMIYWCYFSKFSGGGSRDPPTRGGILSRTLPPVFGLRIHLQPPDSHHPLTKSWGKARCWTVSLLNWLAVHRWTFCWTPLSIVITLKSALFITPTIKEYNKNEKRPLLNKTSCISAFLFHAHPHGNTRDAPWDNTPGGL